MARAEWGSRLGFILTAAGSAIGLGTIWKFPYVSAQNGGGVFLILFLAMAFTFGLFIMIAEMVVGQISQKSPVGAYNYFGGRRWSLVGFLGVFCGFCILSFYSVVGGWTIFYIVQSIDGGIFTSDVVVLKEIFGQFVSNPVIPLGYHVAFMAATTGIVLIGIQKGIERVSKLLMVMLFLLILVLIARSLTLPGAFEGLAHFFIPDFSKLNARMVLEAMGLVFFSLSLGMGCMMTYGSYLSSDTDIPSSAGWVVGVTVTVCFLVGVMILPATYSLGFNPEEGTGLTFIVMPAIFAQMGGGKFFGLLFFFLLFVAALTSSVSLLEVVVSFFIDEFNMPRVPVSIVSSILMAIVGVGASLSFGAWKEYTLFGLTFFGILDYVTSHIMMPFGSIMVSILVGWICWRTVEAHLANGRHVWWLPVLKIFYRFVSPILILIILIQNL